MKLQSKLYVLERYYRSKGLDMKEKNKKKTPVLSYKRLFLKDEYHLS